MSNTPERRANPFRRLDVRLALGVLAVSLPVMAGITGLLVAQSSDSLTDAAENKAASMSRVVARSLESWTDHRQGDMSVVAAHAAIDGGAALGANSRVLISSIDRANGAYALIEVTNLAGEVQASSRSGVSIDPSGEEWFSAAASGQSVLQSPVERDGRIDWVIAQPIVDVDGEPVGVVVGYLRVGILVELLNPGLDEDSEVVAVDAEQHLVYETDQGELLDDAALLGDGSLSTTIDNVRGRQWTRR